MTEHGRKSLIGVFVLGALALLIAVILLMGSGNLFNKNLEFVSFFTSSVQGLVPGSPVYFHGVRVGKVSSVRIDAEPDGLGFRTPVVYEIQATLITGDRMDSNHVLRDVDLADPDFLKGLIERGLRASLGTQSFVTGQLAVNLNMEDSYRPVTPDELESFEGIPQIPAVTSSLDTVLETIGSLPIQDIAGQTLAALRRINETLDEANLPAIADNFNGLISDLRATGKTLPAIAARVDSTLAVYEELGRKVNGKTDLISRDLDEALRGVSQFAATADKFAADAARLTRNANVMVDEARLLLLEDSMPMLELGQTLRALRDAAQSITGLATQLELQPNSLIFGKKGE